ncbi:response regulator [Nodularia spumigena]|uniref:response regulator n=1 Tax=Nodularia spumigena TaxID=70799 RepID=UPI003A93FBD4
MDQVRILVVEDEVIVARTIANQLNQLGYTVTGKASSGEVAIAKALETKPQLILMDIILKGNMDGITAAASIREQLDIPVIFLTAYGDDKTLQRAKLTQPFRHLRKLSNPCSYDIFGERSLTAKILRFYGRIGVRNACCW